MAKRVARIGVLTALAMCFSYLEVLLSIPIGIPGIKLGLANLVIVIGLFILQVKDVLAISFLRILLMGILFGNSASLFYSFAGGSLSFCIMLLGKKTKQFSVMGISIAGGVAHNTGQLLAAMMLLENLGVVSYFPVLVIAGILTGALIGLLSDQIIMRLEKVL